MMPTVVETSCFFRIKDVPLVYDFIEVAGNRNISIQAGCPDIAAVITSLFPCQGCSADYHLLTNIKKEQDHNCLLYNNKTLRIKIYSDSSCILDIQLQKNNTVKDCFLLLLLTAFIYLPFLGLPAWDGNEPLRVIIARDMLKTGDWIIPMLHGKPYFTKPPMMNWLIAGSGSLLGVVNEWTSRIPSVCMVFATALSIYFLTEKVAITGGQAFCVNGSGLHDRLDQERQDR